MACEGGTTGRGQSATVLGLAYGGGWGPTLAALRAARQYLAVGPRAQTGDEHRSKGAGALPADPLVEQLLKARVAGCHPS
jgi:hypothetical protein